MNIKIIAVAIIVLGVIIAGYGIIGYLNAGKIADDYDRNPLLSRASKWMTEEESKESQQPFIPYIVVGGAIAIGGVIIGFSRKKIGPNS